MLEANSPATSPQSGSPEGPRGIGGWLILPLIGFVGTIILTVNNLSAISGAELNALMTSDNPTVVALRFPTLLSLLNGVIMIVIAFVCVVLLSRHSWRLPRAAIIFYLFLLFASLVELWADIRISAIMSEPRDPTIVKDVARSVIAAAIWIPYFLKSKRVRNTFTVRTNGLF